MMLLFFMNFFIINFYSFLISWSCIYKKFRCVYIHGITDTHRNHFVTCQNRFGENFSDSQSSNIIFFFFFKFPNGLNLLKIKALTPTR